jgi:N,N'-diacetyllegionaminate synthase
MTANPIIIAELCQNHKGDIKIMKDMVWAAAEAGATYAKVQSMLADDLTCRERFEEGAWEGTQQIAIKRPYRSEYKRIKPMDLSDEAHAEFSEECRRAGIKPLTTVFSRSRIPFIADLGWDAVKVASYDCASYPMLRELQQRFGHLFVSTGATLDAEVIGAARVLEGYPFSFLHAVTIYPTPLNELHLARMEYLRQFTPSVGWSDHTLVVRDGIKAAIVALSLGAMVIERHFTILNPEATKDGPVSIRPAELKQLVEFSKMDIDELSDYVKREIPGHEAMIGLRQRPLSDIEKLNRDYYRGRFASRMGKDIVYNWEERPAF